MSTGQPDILLETEDYLVVNKPAGILSIPDRFHADKPNVYDWLQSRYDRIFTVHRLDKDTSGVLLFAKTAEAHKALNEQFEIGRVGKIYTAVVQGRPVPEEGSIDAPISADPERAGKMRVFRKGKPSLTLYRVTEYFRSFSLVRLELKTGRTHQIRVHLRHLGFPLAVDPLYGTRTALYIEDIKKNKLRPRFEEDRVPLIERCSLHAAELTFTDPSTGHRVTVEASVPKDLRALLNQLRKHGGS